MHTNKGMGGLFWAARLMMRAIVFCTFFLSLATLAFAVGTPANTSINNLATVTYLGGAPIESSPLGNSSAGIGQGLPTIFKVDNKINLSVQPASLVSNVFSGQSAAITAWQVTNLGNATQDFHLVLDNLASGGLVLAGSDSFDATSCTVRVESGANAGYQASEDTLSYLDELAPDAQKTVYAVCNIPNGLNTGDQANVRLTATTTAGGTPGIESAPLLRESTTNDPNRVDIVFADAASKASANGTDPGQVARDAQSTAINAYKVVTSATVTLLKTLISPNNPALLTPGAMVRYRLTVNVAGASGVAKNLIIADPMPAQVRYVAGSATVSYSPNNVSFASNTLSVNLGDVPAPNVIAIEFNATIN